MKCEKCTEKIKKGDRFCSNCGTKVKKEKKLTKCIVKNQKKIIITLIILIILTILFKVLCYVTGPTFTARMYLNNLINNNAKAVLKVIDMPNNEFLNETILKQKNTDFVNAKNVKLHNEIITEDEALITYSYNINGQEYIASVRLNRNVINKWKVDSGRVTKNVSFKIPTGATVKLDGVNISNYLVQRGNYDLYKIDYMATGSYKLEVALKDGIVLTENIEVTDDTTISIDKINFTDTQADKLEKQAKKLLEHLYDGIKNNKNVAEIEYNNNVKRIYKNLNYNYKISNYKINSIEYNDIEIIKSKYNDEAKLEVTFQTEYTYNITYNKENNYEGINRGYVTVVFDYDGEYKVESIENIKNSFLVRK